MSDRDDKVKTLNALAIRLKRNPIRNWNKIRKVKHAIQATIEGNIDPLSPQVTGFRSSALSSVVDKNNYSSYDKQVKAVYDMYKNKTSYGGELLRSVIDTRVAFIAGEGISFTSKNKATVDYIDKFLKLNKLKGGRLLQMVQTGEMEGKNLIILTTDKENAYIKARSLCWKNQHYTVTAEKYDNDKITEIKYKDKEDKDVKIPIEKAVYVRIGGSEDDINEATNRVHCVLTQIENCSRAGYDLRKCGHLFGRYTPNWKTTTEAEAKKIYKEINDLNWQVGMGYAGTAEFSLKGPDNGGAELLVKDMLSGLRFIATTTAIPIHWFAWPELMNARATAENMLEVVKAGTEKERLFWEEAITQAIEKSMQMAIDAGFEDNNIQDDFTVKLPVISIALLKQLAEVWIPLYDAGFVSKFTMMNMMPGIDPNKEIEQIAKEKEEAAADSPMNNKTVNNTLEEMKNQGEEIIEDEEIEV